MFFKYKYINNLFLIFISIILFVNTFTKVEYNPLIETKNNEIDFGAISSGNINDATDYALSTSDSILHEIISLHKNNQTF